MSRVLVLGTRNRKKLGELVELLAPHGFTLQTLADFAAAIEVEETGDSFAANAALKATVQAKHLGQWVLGEDSGLAVDALGGAPGIFSARYSGEGATDQKNNELLLEKLRDVPLARRTAHYVCAAALSDPTGHVQATSQGICRGRILFAPAGSGGFGYDPLFEVIECHRTFGELAPAVKAVLSHRSRAMRELLPQLVRLAAIGQWRLSDEQKAP
ncbi:MAG: RdgB/HAM1 family non-canonical purine NTP pyrophosphatase [Planctomycetaceae bacterium]|nr:RdgB/HAM1 family non-canonical purine NTP pyrophosphatase [Planctomycetaceae bacterium]